MKIQSLKISVAMLVAACFCPGSALAIDSVMLQGGDTHSRVFLGMSEQELADTIGSPDILKSDGTCYYYRVFDVSLTLDAERRIENIYAGKNFSGSIVRDDGSDVPYVSGAVLRDEEDDEDTTTPLDDIFKKFGEPLETVRRTYAPSTGIDGIVTRETEYKPAAADNTPQALPLEYRGHRILYELYNETGIIKYKYVLDDDGIAFWLDAEKKPYATVIFQTAPKIQDKPNQPLIMYFDFDCDAIKAEYTGTLDEQAGRLRDDAELCVSIEGHADEKGTPTYNDDLSMRRARSVLNFLAARNVPAARMQITAFGERVPAADNTTPEGTDNPAGRILNRRVQIRPVACER